MALRQIIIIICTPLLLHQFDFREMSLPLTAKTISSVSLHFEPMRNARCVSLFIFSLQRRSVLKALHTKYHLPTDDDVESLIRSFRRRHEPNRTTVASTRRDFKILGVPLKLLFENSIRASYIFMGIFSIQLRHNRPTRTPNIHMNLMEPAYVDDYVKMAWPSPRACSSRIETHKHFHFFPLQK